MALAEDAIRSAMAGRFLKGTVDQVVAAARDKAAEMAANRPLPGRGHDGPVRRDCPIECLGLPARAYNGLVRSDFDFARSMRPTVGEVVELAAGGRLEDARQIGPRTAEQINGALRKAGFEIARHHHDHR
ncbi:hypothetical protein [Actinomadura oligospora]|uniref:hypothetical protein n=1 Tax=Actinomadura oligospora TaxID=111804 RepID=UPI0012FBD321|nr:hypothetical protein [Actinomadura oligospora]